ncbi:MAG: F-type H+-transporting ATPase subunit b [Candidatus Taylorbacteria bacterium]|nr:F-type H+-transporting ATPase subunit b [Candidatus Taylorbacteria bacterium]
MESFIHSFGIEWKLLIAQIINFGILAFVLFKLVYKPLLKVLDDRTAMVKDAEEKSSSIEAKLQEIKELEEKVLAEARANGAKLLKDAEISAKELRNKLEIDAHNHAEKIVKEAEARLMADQSKRDAEIRKEIVSVVATAIEATVGKYLDSGAKQKLNDEATKETLKVESFIK